LTAIVDLNSVPSQFTLESVVIDLRGSAYNSRIDLVNNGRAEDSAYSPVELVTLYPRSKGSPFGFALQVSGQVYMESVTLNFRSKSGFGTISVPVNVYGRLNGRNRLNLNAFVNLSQYYGYRIQSVEVMASAVYNPTSLQLLVNNFRDAEARVDRFSGPVILDPRNSPVIGQGLNDLALFANGEVDVQGATLFLTR
jgi:hypothetical protein